MATGQKDLIARLADAGEEAIQRLAGTPGAERMVGVVTNMRDQLDVLSKRVRGMEALERRVEKLERELKKLQGTTSTRRTVVNKKVSPARRTASTSRKKTTSTSRKTSSKSSTRKRSS